MTKQASQEQASRLKDLFDTSGYTEKGLQELLGSAVPPTQQFRPKATYLTREDSPQNVLLRLFFLHEPVALRVVRAILPTWFVDLCVDSDLLAVEGECAVANTALVPAADFLFASDALTFSRMASSDFVLPASSATARYMLDFMMRRPVSTTLDLGTGCGILAHFASKFSGRVVATDINPHASEYAEFNAWLNGVENIEVRTGNLFEPVDGQRFDLILTNPPFVLAPSNEFAFRDNDMVLDEFCGMLARTAPNYLEEGGCFQMICEWVETADEPWHERLDRWFADSNCDIWVLHAAPENPANYAQVRITETSTRDPEKDAANFAEWLDYYRANGITAIHSGIITMRRREGPKWTRIQALNTRVQGAVYEAIEDGFMNRDRLDTIAGEDELLGLTPRLSDDALLEQSYERSNDKWRPRRMSLSIETGLRDEIQLDFGSVEFLTLFDGTRTVAECISALADTRSEEIDEVRESCLPIVRTLIERGFLALA